MACEVDCKRKCFTFIWKLENLNFYWAKEDFLDSPIFTVDEINKTKWKLRFCPCRVSKNSPIVILERDPTCRVTEHVEIDCEIAFVSADSTTLHSFEKKNITEANSWCILAKNFPSWNEMFFERKLEILTGKETLDILTIRCRMWKSGGEFLENFCYFGRTCILVEKRSFLWDIKDFSTLLLEEKQRYEIKSLDTGEELLRLEMFLTGGIIHDETFHLKIFPKFKRVKSATLKISIVDDSKNETYCGEFNANDPYDSKEFIVCYKRELLELVKNDTLSILCESSLCYGTLVEDIACVSTNSPVNANIDYYDRFLTKKNDIPTNTEILVNDFKSMLNNSELSDVKLKTSSKTYYGHKFILSVRSSVFKAMFSNEMKENIKNCVDIEDLSDQTVLDMLRYIYSAEIEELDWARATELYEAADKYQILNLMDICSSFLKTNIRRNNACEALVLADLHQDEDLKSFVQDFILRYGKDIMNSEDWKRLMEDHLKLAAETMHRQFKAKRKNECEDAAQQKRKGFST